MKRSWSLRGRLLAGAVAWSLGLLVLASVAMVFVIERHRGAPGLVHGALRQPLAVVVALGCIAAGLFQVRRGLSGLDRIRRQLAALHDGRERRLTGAFPTEVEPLVADLNRLLDQRDETVARALEAAANLAHGLKTPLSVIAAETDRAAAGGDPDAAASIRQQVDRMQRQVDYQLARARAALGPVTSSVLRESLDGLLRTLSRLHAARDLAIDVRVDAHHGVRVSRADLDEVLGNLLDNACHWARARVVVTAAPVVGGIAVSIDDDGPGIERGMRDAVLRRGVRADESVAGHGLGLAIVRDVAEIYGGSIALGESPMGGLRATLVLPASDGAGPRTAM
jgi:signal transduction histidine kinase